MMREYDEYRELESQRAPRLTAAQVPVYLSGASREADRVRSMANLLESTGLVRVTDRWFDDAAQWSGRDAYHSRDAQEAIVREHASNIRAARIFWMLYPRAVSLGAFAELGYALAHRDHEERGWLRVVVSGQGSSSTVYTGPANYRDECDALGMREVLRIAQQLQSNTILRSVESNPRAWVT